jgi:hypothetical protein
MALSSDVAETMASILDGKTAVDKDALSRLVEEVQDEIAQLHRQAHAYWGRDPYLGRVQTELHQMRAALGSIIAEARNADTESALMRICRLRFGVKLGSGCDDR